MQPIDALTVSSKLVFFSLKCFLFDLKCLFVQFEMLTFYDFQMSNLPFVHFHFSDCIDVWQEWLECFRMSFEKIEERDHPHRLHRSLQVRPRLLQDLLLEGRKTWTTIELNKFNFELLFNKRQLKKLYVEYSVGGEQ